MPLFGLLGAAPAAETVLEGAGVVLRCPVPDDWPAWARLRGASRDFLRPWEPDWPRDALTRSAFRRRLRMLARDREAGTGFGFFVFRRADDALMGGLTLFDVRRGAAQAAALGYWIGERYARRGHMADAVETATAYAFGPLALHRLEAACLPANEASRRLLEGRGFRLEGLARDYLKIDGAWRDHLLFALLKEEWRAGRPASGPAPRP